MPHQLTHEPFMSTTSIILTKPSPGRECTSCSLQAKALADAQARIEELEAQVRVLTLRATSAVEQATEYETSLRRLNSTRSTADSRISVEAARPISIITPASPPKTAVTSRFARLLPSRTISAPSTSLPRLGLAPHTASLEHPYDHLTLALNSPSPSEIELIEALSHEQELRKAAENAVSKTESEIEELTGQLFEQANEMVASERKAKAKLEARVEVLEKRDDEKAKRLGLLEVRVQRVERIRVLLKDESGTG